MKIFYRDPWWKVLWIAQVVEMYGKANARKARSLIRYGQSITREESQLKMRIRDNDRSYPVRMLRPSFDEVLWSPIMDAIAQNPSILVELNHDQNLAVLKAIFLANQGKLLIDKSLALIQCSCPTPHCVHGAAMALTLSDVMGDSVVIFLDLCGCSLLNMVGEMLKRGLDMDGVREGPAVLAWRTEKKRQVEAFWLDEDAAQLPSLPSEAPCDIPPLPLEMAAVTRKAHQFMKAWQDKHTP